MIKATYSQEPPFPATDQHPDAKRFFYHDRKVYSAVEWRSYLDAVRSEAELVVYGVNGAAAQKAYIEAVEERGALKAAVKNEMMKQIPGMSEFDGATMIDLIVVDATSRPKAKEIEDALAAAKE